MTGLTGNLADLSLEDGEKDTIVNLEVPTVVEMDSLENCFVGSFLT